MLLYASMTTKARYAKQNGKIYLLPGKFWQSEYLRRNPDASRVTAAGIRNELLRAERFARATSASQWSEADLGLPVPARDGPCYVLNLPETRNKPGRPAKDSSSAAPWRPATAPAIVIPPGHPFASFTSREMEIAAMLARMATVGFIAYRLGMTPATVHVYLSRMMDKAGTKAVDGWGGRTMRSAQTIIGGPWLRLEKSSIQSP